MNTVETREPAGSPGKSFAFGPFILIPGRQVLLRDETSVRIGGRALDILTALVERPGEIVSKRELMARVWPRGVVEECNLKVNMNYLRRALCEESEASQYIATVVGRGYRFVAPVRALDRSAIRSGSSRKHNIPVATARVVGRTDAILSIHQDLATARLVSIVGTGGIGKTTVALAVAEQARESYAEGVWLIDLAALKDPTLVPAAIASAIGLVGQSTDLAALCEFLRGREMLLLLDSCEHLIEDCVSCVGRILTETAGVRILTTSREPLRLKGERVRRLPVLGTPTMSTGLKAREAMEFPSIELFVERATDRLDSFRLNDANAPLVAEICRRLDGLALAIELAATRVDAFGVAGVLAQLGDRLELPSGYRATTERHRMMTATLDWSYDLLSDSERTLMRRLSIFTGAFSLASACAVAGDNRIDRSVLAECLANLVAKSLIVAEAGGVEMEYRLLDTTRRYALEKLAENGEIESIRQRHAEYCVAFVQREISQASRRDRDDSIDGWCWTL